MLTVKRLELWRAGEGFPKDEEDCRNPKCRSPLTSIIGITSGGTTYRCSFCRKTFYLKDKR